MTTSKKEGQLLADALTGRMCVYGAQGTPQLNLTSTNYLLFSNPANFP